MTQKELDVILEKHKKWLNNEKGGERAILDNENLDYLKLNRASLDEASLDGASLYEASLNRASLDGASLYGASLNRASLVGARNIPYIPMVCPEEGAFYGYKKVSAYIVKLFIPKDAKRSSATSRKCRCSCAKVVSITLLDGSKTETKELVNTRYSPNVTYKVGEYVYPDKFDENRWNECSNGIHFFINRQEAVLY